MTQSRSKSSKSSLSSRISTLRTRMLRALKVSKMRICKAVPNTIKLTRVTAPPARKEVSKRAIKRALPEKVDHTLAARGAQEWGQMRDLKTRRPMSICSKSSSTMRMMRCNTLMTKMTSSLKKAKTDSSNLTSMSSMSKKDNS